MGNDLYTIAEAATKLDVKPYQVRNVCRLRGITPDKIAGRVWLLGRFKVGVVADALANIASNNRGELRRVYTVTEMADLCDVDESRVSAALESREIAPYCLHGTRSLFGECALTAVKLDLEPT